MIRGTVREQPLVPVRTGAFDSAIRIVRWWLVGGRASLGELRGMDYGRPRGDGPCAWKMEALQVKFAQVVQATADLDEHQAALLTLAYREGARDRDIAEALHVPPRKITRDRLRALRQVHRRAEELGLIQRENP